MSGALWPAPARRSAPTIVGRRRDRPDGLAGRETCRSAPVRRQVAALHRVMRGRRLAEA